MPKKRRPRHPPQSPLEQFFSGLKDTVLDFVKDTAYDLHEAVLRAQEEQAGQGQGQGQVPPRHTPPRASARPRTGRTRRGTVPVSTPTHYSVLGVAPTAPQEVIQAAYRALSRIHHPDVPKTGNAERMRKVNEAYAVVGDVKKRKEYDRGLRA